MRSSPPASSLSYSIVAKASNTCIAVLVVSSWFHLLCEFRNCNDEKYFPQMEHVRC